MRHFLILSSFHRYLDFDCRMGRHLNLFNSSLNECTKDKEGKRDDISRILHQVSLEVLLSCFALKRLNGLDKVNERLFEVSVGNA